MIKRIILATANSDKIREIRRILGDLPVDLAPMHGEGAEETGSTLEENAIIKAEAAARAAGYPALADDTGLEVDFLDGAPGVYSSRFAGEGASYDDNVEKLLEAMGNAPRDQRGSRFRCVAALVFPDGTSETVEGCVNGTILAARRGSGGFGYDPLFLPDGEDKTFAEMPLSRKNGMSHRALAMIAMKKIIEQLPLQGSDEEEGDVSP